MRHNEQKANELIEVVGWGLLAVSALGLLANFSFSRHTRDEIIGRARNRSEVSGNPPPPGEALHAMHKNHSKGIVDGLPYDHPDRGIAGTLEEHYNQHRKHVGRAHLIGLTEEENNDVVNLLWSQVQKYIRRRQEVLEDSYA